MTSALMFMILYSFTLFIFDAPGAVILESALKSGLILTLIGTFWTYYIKWGWRVRYLRLGGWLCNIPDLNGRWEGTVCRHNEDNPHNFVIEITQNYLGLSYRSFSQNSRGQSIATVLYTDHENMGVFNVHCLWRTYTRRLDDRTIDDEFEGASFWHVTIDENRKQIVDHYFTRREPPTRGTFCVKWVSYNLQNRF